MSAQFKSDRHLRAERAIQQNEWDVPAWRGLFEEAQKLSVAQARESYDRFLKRFPRAAAYWKLYIEHELDNKNYAQVEELFGQSLLQCNDVSLYETYLAYMKERKTPEELDVMYKWVLDQVGDGFHSTSIHKAGHSNQAEELLDASDEMYAEGRKALPRSLMIAFASADQLEARSKIEEAKAIYEELLKDGGADITLVYINYMKCCRRTNGIKAVREVFSKRVTKDDRCGHQAIVASAQIELEFAGAKASDEKSKKKKEVCVNVFEWGLKKFKDRPQFIQAYLAHLSQKSAEQANTRSVFERIIDSLPADGAEDIWREFHHFETLYGDLKSLERVEQRREEKYPEEFTGKPAKQMVDRYRFMDLLPASSGALRTFGIAQKVQPGAAVAGPAAAVAPAPVQEQQQLPPPREEQRYYMPDIRQLGPFRPTRNPQIPDFGIFMPASTKAMLKLLPPPKFYVAETRLLDVEKLMKEIVARDIPEVAGATLDEPIATGSIPARGKRKITEVAPAADIFQARQRQKAAAKTN